MIDTHAPSAQAAASSTPEQPIAVDRPPRIQPQLPLGEVEIPPPPDPFPEGQARLIQIGLPLLTIVGYVMVSSFGGMSRSPLMMIPMALSVLASSAFALYTYRRESRRHAESEREYNDRLVALTREMHDGHEQQRRFYAYNYPDLADLNGLVYASRQTASMPQRDLRSPIRLWERRSSDLDFAAIRLGVGTLPATRQFVFSGHDKEETPQVRAARKLADDSRFVSQIPVIIGLRPPLEGESDSAVPDAPQMQIPAGHAIALVGEPGDDSASVYASARALLVHFAAFHAPVEAQVHVVAAQEQEWEWLRNLPHAQGEGGTQHLFIAALEEDENANGRQKKVGVDEPPIDQFLDPLRRTLSQRRIRIADEHSSSSDQDSPRLPLLLLVIDLLNPHKLINAVLNNAAVAMAMSEGANLGAAVLFLVPTRSQVPDGCSAVIEIAPAPGGAVFRYAETGINSVRYVGAADTLNRDAASAISTMMRTMVLQRSASTALPRTVLLRELDTGFRMRGGSSVAEQVAQIARERWEDSTKHPGPLQVPIGLLVGGKTRVLTLDRSQDGVHGMIAGSTGSGKSVLLASIVAGLALNASPTMLNFVLIDYKGGGTFNDFEQLPHCVETATNLAPERTARMFTAIRAEISRRQRVIGAAKAIDDKIENILKYHSSAFQEKNPLPFLMIIIDEFAEMLAANDEFKSQLEQITRVGRSLGVFLLLASQSPRGVTDQMRSNITYRICLRVEQREESNEILRRDAAAFLPPGVSGRGYLQVGNDEIELIQVAYVGEEVSDDVALDADVLWEEDIRAWGEPKQFARVLIETLSNTAKADRIAAQEPPWPPFFPDYPILLTQEIFAPAVRDKQAATSTPPEQAEHWRSLRSHFTHDQWLNYGANQSALSPAAALLMQTTDTALWDDQRSAAVPRPMIGVIDDAENARQEALTLDLQQGHTLIIGAPRSGKSTLLRTAVVSLAAAHSSAHVHIYLLDLSGTAGLQSLEQLPHVGGRIDSTDSTFLQRVDHLLSELFTVIEQQRAEATKRAENARAKAAESAPAERPWIVVVIDGMAALNREMQRNVDAADGLMSRFMEILQNARDARIRFVIAATQTQDVPAGLMQHLNQKLALRLNDPADYRDLIGVQVRQLLEAPGRGVLARSGRVLQFQVALAAAPRTDLTEPSDSAWIAQFVQRLASAPEMKPSPFRIDAIADKISLDSLLAPVPADARGLPADWSGAHIAWNWRQSLEQIDWPKVRVGVLPGGAPRTLWFHQKQDGVHAIIGGGTGSGKSGLLATLVTSFAIHYDPRILHLALIDFKGGATFDPFRHLPHCVDFVTNARPADVHRVFIAIDAEIKRRANLIKGDRDDIVKYNQAQMGAGKLDEIEPHLFIIIDEYMELVKSNPAFIPEIEKITLLGRSVGVHLIIAAQRPEVNDQMRANMSLKVALHVDDPDASRELLRRTDAAHLPRKPGRGYIQVGLVGQLRLFQAARVDEKVDKDDTAAINLFRKYAESPAQDDLPSLAQHIIDRARDLYYEQHGAAAREFAPWPPQLAHPLGAEQIIYPRYFTGQSGAAPDAAELLRIALSELRNGRQALTLAEPPLRAVVGLVDDPQRGHQDRLVIDLNKGNLIMFGAAGSGKTSFLRVLAANLAAEHRVGQLHIHLIDATGQRDTSLQKLPHTGTCIIDDADVLDRVNQFAQYLYDIITRIQKERQQQEAPAGQAQPMHAQDGPALVVLIDGLSQLFELLEEQPGALERDGIVTRMLGLFDIGPSMRIWFIATDSEPDLRRERKIYRRFPQRMALRLGNTADYQPAIQVSVSDTIDCPGRGYISGPDRKPLPIQMMQLADVSNATSQLGAELRALEAIGASLTQSSAVNVGPQPLRQAALGQSYMMRTMLRERWSLQSNDLTVFMQELEQRVRAGTVAIDQARVDWLAACVGLRSGNRPADLRFDQQQSGVHAMLAGGTGSGKSELLRTLVLDLALRYPPDVLNFALVDFKGGGSFEPFKDLPHCAEFVTNLDAAAVERFFLVLEAEIARRQDLNKQSGCDHIVDFRRKRVTNGADWEYAQEHYPHLFVIIDEYTELIEKYPSSRDRLESLTRVGRSLGISLVLAAQRAAAVTDEMDANIKLRICLRVEQLETSKLLLRRPDAALLPPETPTGRGYIHQGGRTLDLVQVAYPSGPADLIENSPKGSKSEQPPFFALVIGVLDKVYDAFVPRLWPAPLPDAIDLDTPVLDGMQPQPITLVPALAEWLQGTRTGWPATGPAAPTPLIGFYDAPDRRERRPLSFEWDHVAVFGQPRSGRTTLLRTLIMSLAGTYAPQQLHLYIVDSGGSNFADLHDVPHIGAIIGRNEPDFDDRLIRLVNVLEDELQRRQTAFKALNFAAYRIQENADLPAMLVMIDGVATLKERYESLLLRLTEIARQSARYGIVLALTATAMSDIPGVLREQVSRKLVLAMEKAESYKDLLGVSASTFSATPGRGYIVLDLQARMFQIARPPADLRPIIDALRAAAPKVGLAAPIETLSTRYTVDTLRDTLRDALPAETPLATLQIPIGLRDRDRTPALLDTDADGQHIVVAGEPASGRTTTLRTMILTLAMRYAPSQLRIVLFDPSRKLATEANRIAELPHVYRRQVLDDPELLLPLLREQEQRWRAGDARRLAVVIDGFDELIDEISNNRQIKDDAKRNLITLAKRAGDYGITLIGSSGLRMISNDLYKAVRDSAQGVALRSENAIGFLGGLARSDQRLLPAGRATLVLRKVRGAALQIAITGVGQPEDYAALVEQIIARYPEAADLDTSPAVPPPVAPRDSVAAAQLTLLRRGLRQLLDVLIQQSQPLDQAEIQQLLSEYHALSAEPDAAQREQMLRAIGVLTDPQWIKLEDGLRQIFVDDVRAKWLALPLSILTDLLEKQLQP
ncbi:hypothetical protein K2Z83_19715 [Oscillochloris sp. ZM17-4]|uniref:FtsK/SpoIIIE domain-containing protein n=1 Tax=Oscillochloris sp. ZM17-4 TaxID=2866714 RepID=UPI001C731C9C|nr:FtsK/SpoIIIE domain-containing protein [Oscillochloris sp. ZM17-4]MBX0329896.1 hypothetical protein [Oscillochloris sp. ZM17-4]